MFGQPQQSHFRVRHKGTDDTVLLFTVSDNIEKTVQNQKDIYGNLYEVVNVSKSRFNDLQTQKSPLRLTPQEA